jgi:hypothetical protein
MTWYPCEPVDETYFDTTPYRHSYPVDLDVAPERVWQSLTSDRALADWGLGISLEWTSPRPFGIGTTRSVVLPLHAVTVHERFFGWDEGHRMSFFVTEANRPLLRSFAEDYLVEPTATGSRFTWTVALTPSDRAKTLVRLSDPITDLVCRSVPRRARAYFAKHP